MADSPAVSTNISAGHDPKVGHTTRIPDGSHQTQKQPETHETQNVRAKVFIAQQHKKSQPWKNSVAGIAANMASCIFHPLENVKVRFQGKLSGFKSLASDLAKNNPIPKYGGIWDAMHTIYRHEGLFSLYRGVIINLVAGSLANMCFFYFYQDGKKRYNYDQGKPNSLMTVWISLRAGIISMFLSAPLWTIKTRMVLYREHFNLNSVKITNNIVRDIWKTEGIRGYYHGFIPSVLLSSYSVIQMFCYENVNSLLGFNQKTSGAKDMWIPFITGGISKCLASCTLLPLNVVRMRLQMKQYTTEQLLKLKLEQTMNQRDQVIYKGVIDAFRKIYKNEGLGAFYKGLTPLAMKIFPSSGLFFVTYEYSLLRLNQSFPEE